jgi:hypothetical protein
MIYNNCALVDTIVTMEQVDWQHVVDKDTLASADRQAGASKSYIQASPKGSVLFQANPTMIQTAED